jgi:uncharacterized iron-regulated membrane protein
MILSSLRRWHSYIGLFIAPSVLFFALTGALQIFNLHEAHGAYEPVVLVQMLSAVHKDQVFAKPHQHEAHEEEPQSALPSASGAQEGSAEETDKDGLATLALKCYFLIVALGLIASTSIGIWMGISQIRRKSLGWALLVAGVFIPVCLLAA